MAHLPLIKNRSSSLDKKSFSNSENIRSTKYNRIIDLSSVYVQIISQIQSILKNKLNLFSGEGRVKSYSFPAEVDNEDTQNHHFIKNF